MATQLFLTDAAAQPGTGTNNTKLDGTTSGWWVRDLSTSRGAAATTQATTTTVGPTNGQEIAISGVPYEWISPPLSAAVTVSGTMTFNIWGSESGNTENATFRVVVERYDSQMQLQSQVISSLFGTELTTTNAAKNWTGAPTSTAFAVGDRVRVRVAIDDATATTLGTGSATLSYAGTTSAAAGDTWVQFTEALSFASAPAGSVLYLGDVASTASSGSALNLEAWTSRGSGSATASVTSTAGWRAPIQYASANTRDWFTRPLQAVTLTGICKFNVFTAATARYGLRCEVAVCAADGTLLSVWGAGNFAGSGAVSASAAFTFNVSGPSTAIADGQRLRFRIYSDDANNAAAGALTSDITYAGTSSAAAGDTFVTAPQTFAEFFATAPPRPTVVLQAVSRAASW